MFWAIALASPLPIALVGTTWLLPEGPLGDLFLDASLMALFVAMPAIDWVAWNAIDFEAEKKNN